MEYNPIKRALKHRGRDIKWLASTLNKDYTSLCRRIKEQTLTLKEINSILVHLDLYSIFAVVDKDNNVV